MLRASSVFCMAQLVGRDSRVCGEGSLSLCGDPTTTPSASLHISPSISRTFAYVYPLGMQIRKFWPKFIARKSSRRKDELPASQTKFSTNPAAYPVFPPPPPTELLSKTSYYDYLLNKREHLAPVNASDSPLFALYRLYEHLVLNRTTGLRNELERFWFNRWPVSSIPDPQDQDPERYAVLACIPALMVLAFNKRIELGLPRHANAIMTYEEIEAYRNETRIYESVPDWTSKVKPLEQVLKIPHDGGETLDSFDDGRASLQPKEKNILCWQPHIHFI